MDMEAERRRSDGGAKLKLGMRSEAGGGAPKTTASRPAEMSLTDWL